MRLHFSTPAICGFLNGDDLDRDFGHRRNEIAKYRKIVKATNLKIE
jgi:hypothetical protein